MKYRQFRTLTDDEIKFIIKDLFYQKTTIRITRIDFILYPTYQHFEVEVKTEDEYEDTIMLYENDIRANFNIEAYERLRYEQYLIAKGMHSLLKDNPYLTRIEYENGKLIRKESL